MCSMNRNTRPTPVLTDNTLNVAFAIKYFVYFLFGISGMIVAVPSTAAVAGTLAAEVLASVVAASALTASICAYLSKRGLRYQKVEYYATIILLVFVGVYVGALIYLSIMGDTNRINLAIIASALLIMPAWRLLYLLRNHKK